jgi:hypothetical protein
MRWTGEEIETIRELYPKHGPNWDGWPEAIPEKSRGAIVTQARRLGLLPKQTRAQTKERLEEAPLRDCVRLIAHHLGRAPQAVAARMVLLAETGRLEETEKEENSND